MARIVGCGEGDVAEERLGGRLRGVFLEELDGAICEFLAGKVGGGAARGELGTIEIDDGHLGMIIHAAEEHRATLLECARERRILVVPFACGKGGVAVLAEQFRQEFGSDQIVADIHPSAAAHEHGPAGDAHRSAVGTETIVAAKTGPAAGETIEVGGLDVTVAPGAECVSALIVGEENEKIGPLAGGERLGGGEYS